MPSPATASASGGRHDSWRAGLTSRLDEFAYTRGGFVLAPGPEDTLIPAARFFDRDYLRWAIAQTVPALRGRDVRPGGEADREMRIAVSRFSRRYASLLSAATLVGLANGIGLDVSPARCVAVVRPNGQYQLLLDGAGGPGDADGATGGDEVVRCAERPTPWPVSGPIVPTVADLRDYVWRRLYADHLAPVYALALDVVPVAPHLVWSSAAEWAGLISDLAEAHLDAAAARPYVADRRALLGAARLPGLPRPNPLQDMVEWSPVAGDGHPAAVQTRRHCCITFLLEDRFGRMCDNCPYLSLEDRAALVRAKHGRLAGSPQSPEEQSIMRRARELPVVVRAMRARRRGR
jgi:ferric iron reductase protein FhuF